MQRKLLTLASTLAAREEAFALVTVVRREPPSSVRVGDTALVTGWAFFTAGWAAGARDRLYCERPCAQSPTASPGC